MQKLTTKKILKKKGKIPITCLTAYTKTIAEIVDKFILVCKSFCSKKKEIQDKLIKLTPENAKDNN